jgi:hypothetical protein
MQTPPEVPMTSDTHVLLGNTRYHSKYEKGVEKRGAYVRIRPHTSAYVSIRQHTSACVSIRQHTSAYVSIRQHTSA